jgi:hypothetical protein
MERSSAFSSKDRSGNKILPGGETENSCVKINQQIILTKDQFELLKIISKAHEKSISEYIQKAVLETMKNEIEFGDICDMLLDKLDIESELT